MPDVWADEVAKISGIDAFDVVHVNCCQIMVILTCFLPENDNNDLSLTDNQHSYHHHITLQDF